MLSSVLTDFCNLPNVEVTTFIARSVLSAPDTYFCDGVLHGLKLQLTEDENSLTDRLAESARNGDFIMIIAPECDDVLSGLVRIVEQQAIGDQQLLNLSSRLTSIFADKSATYRWLLDQELSTIPTFELVKDISASLAQIEVKRVVVKPRFGLGCDNVRIFHSDEIHDISEFVLSVPTIQSWVMQPFIAGTACSFAFIGNGIEGEAISLPVTHQHIRQADGRLMYAGGRVPAGQEFSGPVSEFQSKMRNRLPAFRGYLGVDAIICDEPQRQIRIVEVNPRLCTSYVGYRVISQINLAGLLLPQESALSAAWQPFVADFDCNGNVSMADHRSSK